MSLLQLEAARAVCRFCPVRPDCLVEALLRPEPVGIWGGFTRPERDRIIKRYSPRNIDAAAVMVMRVIADLDAGDLEPAVVVLR